MENSNEKTGEIQDVTIGVLAYATIIGFIIAIVMNGDKKGREKKFGSFHLRQSLGLIIFAVGSYIALIILSTILLFISWKMVIIISWLSTFLWLGILALAIMGIVNASNKQEKELPVIGTFSSKFLGKTFE